MKKHNMPYKLSDICIDITEDVFNKYYEHLCNSSAINSADESECQKPHNALKYLWETE